MQNDLHVGYLPDEKPRLGKAIIFCFTTIFSHVAGNGTGSSYYEWKCDRL